MSDAVDQYDLQRVSDELKRMVWDVEQRVDDRDRDQRVARQELAATTTGSLEQLAARLLEVERRVELLESTEVDARSYARRDDDDSGETVAWRGAV